MESSNLTPFLCFKELYDNGDPSHDWLHIERVVKNCINLAKGSEANLRILIPAAVLHDVVNLPKDSKERSMASAMAAERSKTLLSDFGYDIEELNQIGQVILEHSFSANLAPTSIESAILQDADKLDSMGAIGVMRWTTVGTRMGASYYESSDPFGEKRELNDIKYSLDHFEKKLLKLYSRLNTTQAKKEGTVRLEFFNSFLHQLKNELF